MEEKTKITKATLRAYIMIAVLGLIWVYFHWATDGIFLTPRNLSNLMTQMSVTAILAVGMLMVIVSANIDLSVGAVLGFAGGIAAYAVTVLDYGLPVTIIAAIVVGVVIGVFHGALTAYLNIPAFIVTLGGLLAWRGAVKWLLGGNTIPISNETFKAIGQGNVPPNIGWILAIIAIVGAIFMVVRRLQQEKTYSIQLAEHETRVTTIVVGLIVSVLGLISFALPWIGVSILSTDIFQVTGYTFATGLTIAGVSVGGSPVFWIFPFSMLAVCLSTSTSLLQEKFKSICIYSLVVCGAVSSMLMIYFVISERGYTVSYRIGSYLAFLCSLLVLAIGLYAVISVTYLEDNDPKLSIEKLTKFFIPICAILGFIFIMNSYQGIPVPVIIFATIALLGVFVTNLTTFGRYLYAIGGNADAARLSGINNKRNIVKVYALLGALTGVAALIFTARVGSAAPDAGVLKELDAIAACVIGGASLRGGRGTIFGACLGALIMASLDNGMSLLNVRDFMQDIIKGSILVAAVGLDMAGRRQT